MQRKLVGHTEKLLAICRTQLCVINRLFPDVPTENNDLDIMHLNVGAGPRSCECVCVCRSVPQSWPS